METILGKQMLPLSRTDFLARIDSYPQTWLDLGTGDGSFVTHTARLQRRTFLIGLDACRENLVASSRRAPSNTLFVIANALALPEELNGCIQRVSIHFPWGSLLNALLDAEPTLLDGLQRIMAPKAPIEVFLNASALAEAGYELAEGASKIYDALRTAGFTVRAGTLLQAEDLKRCPTTWAKRLAYGRSASGMWLR